MIGKFDFKKKNLHSSIFIMLFCINLCSIIVLSAFNYYVFHHKSSKAYLDSFLTYNQRVTDLAFHNIDEQIIHSVLNISQLYFSPIKENAPILLVQEEQIVNSSEKIRNLTTEIKKIQKSSPYIAGIDIYYEGTQTIVTGFDKVHFPPNDDYINHYLPWYESYKVGEIKEGFQFGQKNAYLMDTPTIMYLKKISMPKWNGKNILLAIYINPDSFSEYIDQQGGTLAILTKDYQVLYNSIPEYTVYKDTSEIIDFANSTNIDLRNSTEPFSIKSNEGSTMVFQMASPVSSLIYLYSMEANRFYKDYEVTNRMFLINFLISIVFNLLVLILISYYNYITYRKRVLVLSENVGITSGESKKSFDSSLTVLTEEITTLHAEVHSSKGLMFQNLVRSVILGRKMGDEHEKIANYTNGNHICAFKIFLTEQEMERLSVEELQEEFLPKQKIYDALFTIIDKDSLVVILIFNEYEWDFSYTDFVQTMYSHWKNCIIVYGLLCPMTNDGIKNSYNSVLKAARYRYIFTENASLSYQQIKMENRKESGSHLKLFEAIKRDINSENLLEIKYHLEVLITSFKNGNYSIDYCLSTLRDLVTLLYQSMEQYQLDMWVVFSYDIREYYKKIPNIDAFYTWCDDLCETILKNIHQKKQSVGIDIRVKIVKLIDDNLENNISLDYLAEQLQIRSDVASRMFRQIMGKSYSEYIKTKKLDRAIELIAKGCSIKEIAEKLGYSSAQYFIKVFKENYGTTPFQYKKNKEADKVD